MREKRVGGKKGREGGEGYEASGNCMSSGSTVPDNLIPPLMGHLVSQLHYQGEFSACKVVSG